MTLEQTRRRVESIVEDFIEYEVPEDMAMGSGPLNHHDTGRRRLLVGYFNGQEVTNDVRVNARKLNGCRWYRVVVSYHDEHGHRTAMPVYGLVSKDRVEAMVDALADVERTVIEKDSIR